MFSLMLRDDAAIQSPMADWKGELRRNLSMAKQPEQPKKLEDRFFDNVSRYPFYFVTTLLGGVWVLVRPLVNLFKRSPLSAVGVVLGAIVGLIFIHLTLRGMAGDSFWPAWVLSLYSDEASSAAAQVTP